MILLLAKLSKSGLFSLGGASILSLPAYPSSLVMSMKATQTTPGSWNLPCHSTPHCLLLHILLSTWNSFTYIVHLAYSSFKMKFTHHFLFVGFPNSLPPRHHPETILIMSFSVLLLWFCTELTAPHCNLLICILLPFYTVTSFSSCIHTYRVWSCALYRIG